MRLSVRAALCALLALPLPSGAQGVLLGANEVGIGIGDVPRVTGVRLNYRDRNLRRVNGANVTVWTPYDDARGGDVYGLALGLPATGARNVTGIAAGVFGVGAEERLRGLNVGILGVGAGEEAWGVSLGGLGVGTGGRLTGISVGGLGVGAGGRVRGISVGGLGVGSGGVVEGIAFGGLGVGAGGGVRGLAASVVGVGSGGPVTGILVGGIGVGSGSSLRGVAVGGAGVGSGGDVTGIVLGGLGVGAGGDLTGISIAGIGVGTGGRIKGFAGGGAVGAPEIVGGVLAVAAGATDVRGVVIAPAYFRIERGRLDGFAASAFNHIKGTQHGVTLGVVNYARRLDGLQIGVINYVRNNPRGRRILPLINWN